MHSYQFVPQARLNKTIELGNEILMGLTFFCPTLFGFLPGFISFCLRREFIARFSVLFISFQRLIKQVRSMLMQFINWCKMKLASKCFKRKTYNIGEKPMVLGLYLKVKYYWVQRPLHPQIYIKPSLSLRCIS